MLQKLNRYWVYFINIQKKVGFLGAMKYALKRLFSRQVFLASIGKKPNPIEFYDFIYSQSFGEVDNNERYDKIINWVIPDFTIGSGGHLTIFRFVKKLEEKGFTCRINIDGPSQFQSGEEARACIRKNFFPIKAEVGIGRVALRPAAATFATGWTTAYTVRDFKWAGKRYYFVQDFEPFFFALSSEYFFAEETYRFGFKGITAGNWLADKLRCEYGMEAASFGFSFDRELYKPFPRCESQKKRVFYYARPVTPRRAFELGLLALASVHKKNPDIEFILAGWYLSGYEIPFPYINAGVLSPPELSDVYSQCDVALVLSFTNLSLLPLEVMACSCAVVTNCGDNVEWLLNENIAKFAEPTPEALCNAIIGLFDNPNELNQLKENGLEFSLSTNWDKEVEKIVKVIEEDLI